MSAALFTGPVGEWAGPFRSAYGWHLVRIIDRQPARHAELGEVRGRVEADYLADVRVRANEEAYRKLASKYRIVTDGPRTAAAGPAATSGATASATPTAIPTAIPNSAPTAIPNATPTAIPNATLVPTGPPAAAAPRPATAPTAGALTTASPRA